MWGFCQPKTAPTRLREVSYHWAVGEQQGGYRNRLRKVFSRSHHAAFSKKTGSTPGCFKNIWRFRRFPCRLLRLPKRIGLKSYLRLSALVVRSSSITSSDASTHFRPGERVVERLNLR